MIPAIGWRDEDATEPKPSEACRSRAMTWQWYPPEKRWVCGAYPHRQANRRDAGSR
jgi:hypothetical protein